MSIEIITIEVCGRMISDFPEMPLEFALDMARQCWDNSRHAILCYDRILQLGGNIGQFPIDTQLWTVSFNLSLELRLAVHQQIGEWLGVDGAVSGIAALRDAGDLVTARALEYVLVDEIAHVGYGNKWVHYIAGTDEATNQVYARALAQRASFGQTVNGGPDLPFNRRACERSGFTPAEIEELERTRAARPVQVSESALDSSAGGDARFAR